MASETVTFLFTDIEASTRRWEADAPAMSAALARHDAIMRASIESAGGAVFKHTGDGVCAVFVTAAEGFAAAVNAQRALHAEDWGEAGEMRVRMALHSGTAERRAGDYFGPALNRVARLMATAHGGQIVASRTSAQLAREAMPAGAELLDLGEHRLHDLARPEHVFQLSHPDLPVKFPPLRSLAARRHNLPRAATPFIGRECELDELQALLAHTGLLTLTGAGGAGKTRLALESALRALPVFPDGAFLVELAPLTDPELVAQAVVAVLGLVLDRLSPGPAAVVERLCEHLADRRALIVLDNCEHLVGATAALADTLLRRCPSITVLATSREPLGVPGETLWRVPSLSLPVSGAVEPDEMAGSDAVALLCDRATAADPSFRLTGENVVAVAQICRRLDGIPLALELAAARFRLLRPDEVAARLDDRFHLLTAGARTLDRHRTVRATVDWGYDLLSEAERTVLGRLSVFAGGFDLEAAEAVVPDDKLVTRAEVIDLLGRLVDRSWVTIEPDARPSRFGLLETIRQYAAGKLDASGEGDEVRRRHAGHFRDLATFEPDQPLRPPAWMRRAEAEEDNLRAALEWGFKTGDSDGCLRMAAGLSRFWGLTGRVVEGRAWLERVLEAAPARGTGMVAALNGMGFLMFQAGEPPARAAGFHRRAREVAQAIGDRAGDSVACSFLGFRALQRGELDEADRLVREAMEELPVTGSAPWRAWGEWCRGWIASARGDLPGAVARFEVVLTLARADEDSVDLLAHALAALGPLLAVLGEGPRAQRLADEAVAAARRLGVSQVVVMALVRSSEVAIRLHELAQAAQHLDEALVVLKEMDGLAWVAYCLELTALLATARQRHRPAARLLGCAHALDEISGESSKARPLHDEVDGCRAELSRLLGSEEMAVEVAAGATLPVKEALSLALHELGSSD